MTEAKIKQRNNRIVRFPFLLTCSGQSCLLLSALSDYIPNMAEFDGQSKMILRKTMEALAKPPHRNA
jgi:hypothetical protein